MEKKDAVERVIARVYKDRFIKTGVLPEAKEVRDIEKKVREAAEHADNLKNRK